MGTTLTQIGMGVMEVNRSAGTFACVGLGSCIGLCMMDPVTGVGGCTHVVLPESLGAPNPMQLGKYADVAVKSLVQRIEELGGDRKRMRAAIAGGAKVFSFEGKSDKLDIGGRNTEAVKRELEQLSIPLVAVDIGGNLGRTLTFDLETGHVMVRTVTQAERRLCSLKDQ